MRLPWPRVPFPLTGGSVSLHNVLARVATCLACARFGAQTAILVRGRALQEVVVEAVEYVG